VKVSIDGPISIVGESKKVANFKGLDNADVYFSLETKDVIGKAEIRITASTKNFSYTTTTEIAVRPVNPKLLKTFRDVVLAGNSISMTVPAEGIKGLAKSWVDISKLDKIDADNRLYWLIRYPYGCLEQTTSAALPQIRLKDAIDLTLVSELEIDNNINFAIKKFKRFQKPRGGFTYWPGGTKINDWACLYAGYFLLEAKEAGYYVPGRMLKKWLNYQSKVVKQMSSETDLQAQAFRVYLLAKGDRADIAAQNILMEDYLSKMNDVQRWMLAGAYYRSGKTDAGDAILQKTGTLLSKDYNSSRYYNYGSIMRDKAIMLTQMQETKRYKQADKMYNEIVDDINSGRWYSTQSLGWSLTAAAKYMEYMNETPGDTEKVKGSVVLANGKKIPFSFKGETTRIELDGNWGQPITVNMTDKSSLRQLHVNLNWNGIPIEPITEKVEEQIRISTFWRSGNGSAMKIDEFQLKV